MTILCDIDGTIFEHSYGLENLTIEQKILPGVKEKFEEWNNLGYKIILLTARPEEYREFTIQQFDLHDIKYDYLIMGLSAGPRIVINDTKPNGVITAIAKPVKRDVGLNDLHIG